MTAAEYQAGAKPKRKYRNELTEVDGVTFASKAEARRYGELKLLEYAGEIYGLILQPRFVLEVNGVKITTYVADFEYRDREDRRTVEDVKGVRTTVYKLKKKLMYAVYGIEVTEV